MAQFIITVVDGETTVAVATRHGLRAAHDAARRLSRKFGAEAFLGSTWMATALYDRGRAVTGKVLFRALAASHRAAVRGGYAYDATDCPF